MVRSLERLSETVERYISVMFFGIYTLVMFALGLLIVACIFRNNGVNADYAGFWGSIIGALATIAAVYLTMRGNEKREQNRLRASLYPYVNEIWSIMDTIRAQIGQLLESLDDPFRGVANGDAFKEGVSDQELTKRVLDIHIEHLKNSQHSIGAVIEKHEEDIPLIVLDAAKNFARWLPYFEGVLFTMASHGDTPSKYAITEIRQYQRIFGEKQEEYGKTFERFIRGEHFELKMRY